MALPFYILRLVMSINRKSEIISKVSRCTLDILTRISIAQSQDVGKTC